MWWSESLGGSLPFLRTSHTRHTSCSCWALAPQLRLQQSCCCLSHSVMGPGPSLLCGVSAIVSGLHTGIEKRTCLLEVAMPKSIFHICSCFSQIGKKGGRRTGDPVLGTAHWAWCPPDPETVEEGMISIFKGLGSC